MGAGAVAAPARAAARAGRGGGRGGAVRRAAARGAAGAPPPVTLLDYGAGNVRSIRNAIAALGYEVRDVEGPQDIANAERLVFPGVGAFGAAMDVLAEKGYTDALKEYVASGERPFLGICIGMQVLFEGSEESPGVEGLGVVPGMVTRFDPAATPGAVPHMGWNGIALTERAAGDAVLAPAAARHVYYTHSYHATPTDANAEYIAATTNYGEDFVAAVKHGNVYATQFHPEKSGNVGLALFDNFLGGGEGRQQTALGRAAAQQAAEAAASGAKPPAELAKRVIACLDVRANDAGDMVVTKGDQYDVREDDGAEGGDADGFTNTGAVRNLGKPVELAGRYSNDGADEVTFLNITGFRDCPLEDMPMLDVLRLASESIFVPLTVGGGIKSFTDSEGKFSSALEVAAEYFRSGADKVSIGSDSVDAAEAYYANGEVLKGDTAIEQISRKYGAQAVVVSVDPRRVYVSDPASVPHHCTRAEQPGPDGEEWCWYQCTVKGGREGRPLGAYELARAVEALGAGEVLLNLIDKDGTGSGFDCAFVDDISRAVSIPVIASSGAGAPEHFSQVFEKTKASAALAAGIFHRREVGIDEVKEHLVESGVPTRLS